VLQIKCPWCGVRDEDEFVFGGESGRSMPHDPQSVSDCDWAAYLFHRTNPKGPHLEQWQHRYGCRQWFGLERDTLSHEILAVFKIGQSRSAGESS
jgi:heterotetrameric sarcosine oxidase delta subunit